METPADKARLRGDLEARIGSLSAGDRAREGQALTRLLGPWTQGRGFQVVLATLPLDGEPDLTAFLEGCLSAGARVAFARTGPARSLGFRFVDTLEGPWEDRPFGLREPPLTLPPWEPGARTLCLVPGLAFAPAPGGGGLRLGRGAGYYDRWLAQNGPSVFALGVGLSVQTLDTLPTEAHDRRLDGWVDPEGFHGF